MANQVAYFLAIDWLSFLLTFRPSEQSYGQKKIGNG